MKAELKQRKLSEEDIKKKRLLLEEYEVNIFDYKNAVKNLEEEIKLELPMKKARMKLRQIKQQLELFKSNQKVIEKQIRTKIEKYQ